MGMMITSFVIVIIITICQSSLISNRNNHVYHRHQHLFYHCLTTAPGLPLQFGSALYRLFLI